MYAYYCLLASYWYHIAWLGCPPEQALPANQFAHARAIFYTGLCVDAIPETETFLKERERYHAAYKIWRNSSFKYPHLFMVLHFLEDV